MQTPLKPLLLATLALLPLCAACGSDPAVASLQLANLPSATIAGGTQFVSVNALDSSGALVAGYTGTVHFTSTNPAVQAPSDYTFVTADSGSHPFAVEFGAVGAVSLTVSDLSTPSLTATAATTTAPPPLTGIALSVPLADGLDQPVDLQVTVSDSWGGAATLYTGTVHFTSSDPQAQLPADYTFTSADSGVHLFAGGATFLTAGTQTVTVADAAAALNASVSGVQVQ